MTQPSKTPMMKDMSYKSSVLNEAIIVKKAKSRERQTKASD